MCVCDSLEAAGDTVHCMPADIVMYNSILQLQVDFL